MIVYQSSKAKFLENVLTNNIENIILGEFKVKLGRSTSSREVASWKSSLMYMHNVLLDEEIPSEAGIAIEYQIPQTAKRIDFIVTGSDESRTDHAVLIELKQWQEAQATEKDGIVITALGGGLRETNHPSYQAWSYAALLYGFNEAVQEDGIQLKPCAYLHNYADDGVISGDFYAEYIQKAPLFLQADALKLRGFIKEFVKHGDDRAILYRIDNGRLKPSKALADSMVSMLKGNQEFVMIDDQKIVFETALALARKSAAGTKNVLIVEGGPGTGKSVVAINLLVALTKGGLLAQYVTKNAAPRDVYEAQLTGSFKRSAISSMFTGSGKFINIENHLFDALIVDEAHRLSEKSGMFKNLGENQIKELINAAKFTVFFVDEDQRVTMHDIGSKDAIVSWAESLGANVHHLALESQFRCNGSDGYLAWLDNALQIRDTANFSLEGLNYDFRVVDSPIELRDLIFEKNKIRNKARLVAGYCWEWKSRNDREVNDVIIPEYDFAMQWNLATDGNLWIQAPESVNQIGCIHTCQGLEMDYVGVIVGKDLVVRDGNVVVDSSARARSDSSVKGLKKLAKENPEEAARKAALIIKNTYRTLMTRGMKGCYVYFVDQETRDYFKGLL